MVRLLLIFTTLLGSNLLGYAQIVPDYINGNTGFSISIGNPLSSTWNKAQWIYGPGVFNTNGQTGNPAFAGNITRIYFRLGTTVSSTTVYSDFTVSLGQHIGTIDVWPDNVFDTGLTEVFYQPTYQLTLAAPSSWVYVDLPIPFYYDPAKSLAFGLKVSDGQGNHLAAKGTIGLNQRRYGPYTDSIGEPGVGIVDFGFDLIPVGANDVGVVSIDSPTNFCASTQNVVATIKNWGTNQVHNVTVNWTVNGIAQIPVVYNSLLDTLRGTGNHEAQVLLGNWNFTANTPYSIVAWTSNPNGVHDSLSYNDTLTATIQTGIDPPTGLAAISILGEQATITWAKGELNNWLYSVVPHLEPPVGPGITIDTPIATIKGLTPETMYDFYVRGVCPIGDTSNWAGPITFTTPFQCPAYKYCFNTCGKIGNTGPGQGDCDTTYSGTGVQGMVTVTNGIQEWAVPEAGLYRIEAFGAQGSNPTLTTGGLGAYMSGEFLLNQGETVRILVGQTAPNTPGRENRSSSGGGGTFVTRSPHNTNASILLVAGGGGGTGNERPSTSNATPSTSGQKGSHGTGGIEGNGGTSPNSLAGAGAGFFTNGVGGGGAGMAYVNGGAGGPVHSAYSENGGGFGGGGSVTSGPSSRYGGGGGYSGGSGSSLSIGGGTTGLWGGGGGSFNNGTKKRNQGAVRFNNGLVVITPYRTGSLNDIGAISIDSPANYCTGTNNVVATIINYGINQVTSATVYWSINGVLQPPATFNGILDTLGGSGSITAQVMLGSYAFTSSSYDIVVWSSMPNGQPDSMNINDTTFATVQSGIPAPTNLSNDSVTANEAFISWTGNPLYNWLYMNLPTGLLPSGSGSAVSTNSVTITGLTPLTRYDFYVREVCPGGDTSAWVGPLSYLTKCLHGLVDSVAGDIRCGAGSVVLHAYADANYSINWYDAPTGGGLAGTGTSLMVPQINSTKTYYAAANYAKPGTDTLAHPLNFANNTGVYHHVFTVEATIDLNINSIGIKCNQAIGTLTNWDIYYRPDNYQLVPGANGSPAGWTLLSSVNNVPSNGTNAFTEIGSNLNLAIPGDSTFSIYIAPGAGTTHHYRSTTPTGTITASNPDLTIRAGHRGSNLFNLATSGGQAVVNIKYSLGCDGPKVPVTATIFPVPVIDIGNDTFYCDNDSSILLILDAADQGNIFGVTYQWSTGSAVQAILVDTAGVYSVTVTAPGNCQSMDQITVFRHPSPYVDIGSDTAICDNTQIFLVLNATQSGLTYQWSSGSQAGQIVATQPGIYSVTVTNNMGCSASDSISITEKPSPIVAISDIVACDGIPVVLDAGNPGSSYVWSNQANTQTISVTASGQYQVTVTDPQGCSSMGMATVTILPIPVVDLGSDTSVYQGAVVRLDASNPGATYLWSTGATTQVIEVTIHGTYSVTVTAANGCEGIDSITIAGTGIHTVDGLGRWIVFPNPATDMASLRLELARGGNVAIELYDPSSRRVWEQDYPNATGTETISIPMQALAQGIYLLRVRLDGQLIGTSLIGRF